MKSLYIKDFYVLKITHELVTKKIKKVAINIAIFFFLV